MKINSSSLLASFVLAGATVIAQSYPPAPAQAVAMPTQQLVAPGAAPQAPTPPPPGTAISQSGLLPLFAVDLRIDPSWIDGTAFPSTSPQFAHTGVSDVLQQIWVALKPGGFNVIRFSFDTKDPQSATRLANLCVWAKTNGIMLIPVLTSETSNGAGHGGASDMAKALIAKLRAGDGQQLAAYSQVMSYQIGDRINNPGLHHGRSAQQLQQDALHAAEALRNAESQALAGANLQPTPIMVSASFDYEMIAQGAISGLALDPAAENNAFASLNQFLGPLEASPNIEVLNIEWMPRTITAGDVDGFAPLLRTVKAAAQGKQLVLTTGFSTAFHSADDQRQYLMMTASNLADFRGSDGPSTPFLGAIFREALAGQNPTRAPEPDVSQWQWQQRAKELQSMWAQGQNSTDIKWWLDKSEANLGLLQLPSPVGSGPVNPLPALQVFQQISSTAAQAVQAVPAMAQANPMPQPLGGMPTPMNVPPAPMNPLAAPMANSFAPQPMPVVPGMPAPQPGVMPMAPMAAMAPGQPQGQSTMFTLLTAFTTQLGAALAARMGGPSAAMAALAPAPGMPVPVTGVPTMPVGVAPAIDPNAAAAQAAALAAAQTPQPVVPGAIPTAQPVAPVVDPNAAAALAAAQGVVPVPAPQFGVPVGTTTPPVVTSPVPDPNAAAQAAALAAVPAAVPATAPIAQPGTPVAGTGIPAQATGSSATAVAAIPAQQNSAPGTTTVANGTGIPGSNLVATTSGVPSGSTQAPNSTSIAGAAPGTATGATTSTSNQTGVPNGNTAPPGLPSPQIAYFGVINEGGVLRSSQTPQIVLQLTNPSNAITGAAQAQLSLDGTVVATRQLAPMLPKQSRSVLFDKVAAAPGNHTIAIAMNSPSGSSGAASAALVVGSAPSTGNTSPSAAGSNTTTTGTMAGSTPLNSSSSSTTAAPANVAPGTGLSGAPGPANNAPPAAASTSTPASPGVSASTGLAANGISATPGAGSTPAGSTTGSSASVAGGGAPAAPVAPNATSSSTAVTHHARMIPGSSAAISPSNVSVAANTSSSSAGTMATPASTGTAMSPPAAAAPAAIRTRTILPGSASGPSNASGTGSPVAGSGPSAAPAPRARTILPGTSPNSGSTATPNAPRTVVPGSATTASRTVVPGAPRTVVPGTTAVTSRTVMPPSAPPTGQPRNTTTIPPSGAAASPAHGTQRGVPQTQPAAQTAPAKATSTTAQPNCTQNGTSTAKTNTANTPTPANKNSGQCK